MRTDRSTDRRPDQEPSDASALLVNSAGEYLLHLRDDIPGIRQPGRWALPGGGREADETLRQTVERELEEEAGLRVPGLSPFSVVETADPDGRPVRVQVFLGAWDGDPHALTVHEGVMLHFFPAATLPRLRLCPGTRTVLREHQRTRAAGTAPAAGVPPSRHAWDRHYAEGRNFRPLGDEESALLATHLSPARPDARALDLCCGTGELARALAASGYERVVGADFAPSALARARAESAGVAGVEFLGFDIERDNPAYRLPHPDFDLVTCRLSLAFLHDPAAFRARLHALVRPGGRACVITPLADRVPAARRGTAVGQAALDALAGDWPHTQHDAAGLAVLVLHPPRHASPVTRSEHQESRG
ncbi:methyltransferase domain-containing protein [Streptomyces sp. NPDC048172]|uniref:methyltransferase domain-containing protein n=1 Tax=Streptomyces sp. NPDC048172 TaxID=3365505 RepID=UPI00371FAFD0